MHRLQKRSDGKPPKISLQFMTVTTRVNWLRGGKKAILYEVSNSKTFFNENLTFFNKRILKEARAKMYGYSHIWFQGGKILAKQNHDYRNVIVIRRIKGINKRGCAINLLLMQV